MRAIAVSGFLALLGSACTAAPPVDPAQAQCERQAEDDPEVKLLANRALANADLMVNLRADIKYAYNQAVIACLRKKGIGPKGGVEPLRP